MNSGDYTGSRFGLRGAEEFGNGWKVGFVLENGFSGDSGELGDGDRIFDREAIVYADGPWASSRWAAWASSRVTAAPSRWAAN